MLSGLIYEHVEDEEGLSRIHIKGDRALFGGVTTRQMKRRLQVPKGRALADFLPAIVIKAKDFATELTNAAVKRRLPPHRSSDHPRARQEQPRSPQVPQPPQACPRKPAGRRRRQENRRRFAADEKKLAELVPQLSLPRSNRVSQLVLALN